MQTDIPSAEQVRVVLQGLSHAQMQALATASGVPFTTLWKLRSGETPNPRIETVRSFLPYIEGVRSGQPAPTQAAATAGLE